MLPVALLLVLMGFPGFIFARNVLLNEWVEASVLKLQRAAHYIDRRLSRPIQLIDGFHHTGQFRSDLAIQERLLDQLRAMDGVSRVDFEWRGSGPPGSRGGLSPASSQGTAIIRMGKPHFHVTVGLVWQGGKLLSTRQPQGSHLAGYWEFPGGKQEPGESLEACLEREFREELGMEVKAVRHLLQIDHDYETKSITLHLFQYEWLSGEPLPIGCDEILWVQAEDLATYKLPPPDYRLLPFIQNLTEKRRTSDMTPLRAALKEQTTSPQGESR